MPRKRKDPNSPFLYHFAPNLRPRVEAHLGHKTLTGLLNDILLAWVQREERKSKKP